MTTQKRHRWQPSLDFLERRPMLAPVVAPIPDQFAEEGQTVAVQVMAIGNAGPIAYSLTEAPQGASVTPTGLILWATPSVQQSTLIDVTATDASGSASVTFRAWVFDHPPVVAAGPNDVATVDSIFTRSGSFADPDPDTWTAVVDYGDGSGIESLPLAGQTFALSHIYFTAGSYTVVVTVTDSQGFRGIGAFSVTATVATQTPTVSVGRTSEPGQATTGTPSLSPIPAPTSAPAPTTLPSVATHPRKHPHPVVKIGKNKPVFHRRRVTVSVTHPGRKSPQVLSR